MAERPRWSATGLVLAEVAYVLALLPSLLPRTTGVQAAVSALAMAVAYGIGAALGLLGRTLVPSPRPRRPRVVAVVLGAGAVACVVLTFLRTGLQAAQAAAIGAPPTAPNPVLVLVVSPVMAVVLVLAGRGLRRAAQALAAVWARAVPARPWATLLGAVTVTAAVLGVVGAAYASLHLVYDRLDASTAGQTPPVSPDRSGGAGSLVPWADLGAEGRSFVSGGPTPQQLSAFSGLAVTRWPGRVFVGLDAAPDAASRAALAVEELRRTNAFDRSAIVVITSTGNGFVDPVAADSLEYVLGGDVASVAVQYSVLPSWISFLVDQAASQEAGQQLFAAVRAAVDALPSDERPRLYVYGESLGAFGSQAAFAGRTPDEVVAQVDGALWVGPPAASDVWSDWNSLADGGTAWEPVVEGGRTVRYAATEAAITPRAASWGPRRVLFAQNATDPVVWFDYPLVLRPPDWLDQPRGPGVPEAARWWSVGFFLQVLLDLPGAVSAPAGSGHDYSRQVPVAWVAVIQPPGWTDADTGRLLEAVG